MRTRRFSLFASVLLAIVLLALANRFSGQIGADAILAQAAAPAQYIIGKVAPLRHAVDSVFHFRRLAHENAALQARNKELTQRLAELDTVEQENDFLRRAGRITQSQKLESVTAGMFAVHREPGMISARLNRGSGQGIVAGATVVTGKGQLLGSVLQVLPSTARIRLANDAGIEIAARVLGKTTNGILQAQGTDELLFELIAQGEDIEAGDTIVTAGTDMFPSGLVVGMVTNVQKNESGIFQKVIVHFGADPKQEGTVIVLLP